MKISKTSILFIAIIIQFGCQKAAPVEQEEDQFKTFCNPLNISYRFGMEEPSRREAADPTVVWFRDSYFLFASKSGGYWHSQDLIDWEFVETNQIPTEEYAPTVIAIEDTLYFLASSAEKSTVYKSADPIKGKWEVAVKKLERPVWDPAFFMDTDDRLYLYWGCSNKNPLYGVEIDYQNNFAFLGEPTPLKYANPEQLGWEVPGDYNTLIQQKPWIEGAWMNKYHGKYYLQYSGPGTEFKSYSDGVLIGDSPLGPFKTQEVNPFSYKPEGFIAGAGHGSTFSDRYGNYWHIGTMTISQKHMFERRLGLFPVFFDEQGTMYSTTRFGDYPLQIPNKKISSIDEIFPGWMLLSFNKTVEVSSSIDSLPASHMVDENIRTYWAATGGESGEYALLDLGKICDVNAIQINFAEHESLLFGINNEAFHRYTLEYSNDKSNWTMIQDHSQNETDNTHVYLQLNETLSCRYIKVTNQEVPSGHFAISGFRVFGLGEGESPTQVSKFQTKRNPENRRSTLLTWSPSQNATGYTISYGIHPDKLYLNYQVYEDTAITINSLNTELDYYFSISAFNENGISKNGSSPN